MESESPVAVEDAVVEHFELAAQIDEIARLHEAELEPFRARLAELDRKIHEHFNSHPQLVSVPTRAGTAEPKLKTFINISNWDEFLAYVLGNSQLQLLKKDVNKTAAEEIFSQSGAYPPGVKTSSEKYISYTKPRKRAAK